MGAAGRAKPRLAPPGYSFRSEGHGHWRRYSVSVALMAQGHSDEQAEISILNNPQSETSVARWLPGLIVIVVIGLAV